jgi:lactate permease
MYALLAFIPIVFCVVVMAVFNWPAKLAMPISWLVTAVLGLLVWNLDILALTAYDKSWVSPCGCGGGGAD